LVAALLKRRALFFNKDRSRAWISAGSEHRATSASRGRGLHECGEPDTGRREAGGIRGLDWSREEVEATVADYIVMLTAEIRGESYSKTEHRRSLKRLLRERTDAAIERKHGNISAVLIELGFPYISGYKPYGNYQGLLREVVASRLSADHGLTQLVEADVEEPVSPPSVADILAAWVSPPSRPRTRNKVRERPTTPYGGRELPAINYLEREAKNRALGDAGELFVMAFEQARLVRSGCEALADRVEHVARTRGPAAGFDVLSFEPSGQERLVEVKTTRYGAETPFFLTRNELQVSEARAAQYHLYRVFDFRMEPRLFGLPGPVSISCTLDPCQYIASVA